MSRFKPFILANVRAAILGGLSAAVSGPTAAASFNCAASSNAVEQMICADPKLSKLDDELATKYKNYRPRTRESWPIRAKQRRWLEGRNSCTNVGCIEIYYRKRIAELTKAGRTLSDLVAKLEMSGHSSNENTQFCTQFLTRIQQGTALVELKPIEVADSISDRRLVKHFGKCTPAKLVRSVSIEPRIWDEYQLDGKSEEELEEWGMVFVQTRAFRLYKTKIANDPSNAETVLLYGAGTIQEGTDFDADLANFNVIDIEKCRVLNSAQVQDVANQEASFVGLATYDGKAYIYNGEYFPFESLWAVNLMQWEYSPMTKIKFFSNVCHFIAKDSLDSSQ